jgi:hypothetical protein
MTQGRQILGHEMLAGGYGRIFGWLFHSHARGDWLNERVTIDITKIGHGLSSFDGAVW